MGGYRDPRQGRLRGSTSRTRAIGLGKYDHIVELAEQNGMELIVRISNPPAWSRAQGNDVGAYAPPDEVQDFADFVEAVVTRYRGRIRYYQLWNEPNIYPEWGSYPIDPEAYAQLLKAGAEAARVADPDAVIIAGAWPPPSICNRPQSRLPTASPTCSFCNGCTTPAPRPISILWRCRAMASTADPPTAGCTRV
ncbi:MAG: glycoside hydrolase family 5 protein [Caldilineaceae bacterium]|nr:glycoside hydrolase family 5 protein [Caldilineaceae bacterium]